MEGNGRKNCLDTVIKNYYLYNSFIWYSFIIIYIAMNTPRILAIVVFILKIITVAIPKPV